MVDNAHFFRTNVRSLDTTPTFSVLFAAPMAGVNLRPPLSSRVTSLVTTLSAAYAGSLNISTISFWRTYFIFQAFEINVNVDLEMRSKGEWWCVPAVHYAIVWPIRRSFHLLWVGAGQYRSHCLQQGRPDRDYHAGYHFRLCSWQERKWRRIIHYIVPFIDWFLQFRSFFSTRVRRQRLPVRTDGSFCFPSLEQPRLSSASLSSMQSRFERYYHF